MFRYAFAFALTAAVASVADHGSCQTQPADPADPLRILHDRQGRSIEARILGVDGEQVTIERSDGRRFAVSIAIFAPSDQEFIRSLASSRTAADVGYDWPQFRYNAGRTAASPEELPNDMELRWTRQFPTPKPAFPQEVRLAYDVSYEPVVSGDLMFVPSMVTDSVTALDIETGAVQWRFFAEAPVRFAPSAREDSVYFVSDDGYLYCLNAIDGSLRWKFRGLPQGRTDRKIFGNGRLISLFAARGGPVIAEGKVYFAAGLWPTEGVFVHALDAESGELVWSNKSVGRVPTSNWDHGIGQVAGLSPQGYLAVVGGQLVAPCGAQLPAFLDLHTGDLGAYTTGWGGRVGLPKGCWFVAGMDNYLSHAGDLYDITRPNEERFAKPPAGKRDFKKFLYPGGWTRLDIEPENQRFLPSFRQPVLTADAIYESDEGITARALIRGALQRRVKEKLPPHRQEDLFPDRVSGEFRQLWKMPSRLDVHIKAGSRLYVGGPRVVQAIDVTRPEPKIVWRSLVKGAPHRMLAAHGRLFVVTAEGSIHAFAAPGSGGLIEHVAPRDSPPSPDEWTERAKALLKAANVTQGYALVLGIDRGRLVEELARQSRLHVIAVDRDSAKVNSLRHRLHGNGLYGARTTVLVGDPLAYPFPPFFADLVVSETGDVGDNADARTLAMRVFHTLRPFGGVACAWETLASAARTEEVARDLAVLGADIREAGDFVFLSRKGPLPGSGDWSHADANAACTGASEDEFARAPLTPLWFDAAQRWHKFPGQVHVRVAGGRLVLLESGRLRASDVYTGRLLWEATVPVGLGEPGDAAARAARHAEWGPKPSLPATTELVVLDDAIYLTRDTTCLIIDPKTGRTQGRIDLPKNLKSPWAHLRVTDQYLVGASGNQILCYSRRTRRREWSVEASSTPLDLVVGPDMVFCSELADPKRGQAAGSMFALALDTGRRVWRSGAGARLRYCRELDLIVTPTGFHRASDGQPVKQFGKRLVVEAAGGFTPKGGLPGLVAGKKLLTGTEETLQVYGIPSGQPLGGVLKWNRRGCTGTRASTHLMTTRYRANSAWIDLHSREIRSFLGIRPACRVNNNLFPANGLLNMPNLTAGCSCNYTPVSMACVPVSVLQTAGPE